MNKIKWQISNGRFSSERVAEFYISRTNFKIEDVNYLYHESHSGNIYFHVANNETECSVLRCGDNIEAREIYLALNEFMLNCKQTNKEKQ